MTKSVSVVPARVSTAAIAHQDKTGICARSSEFDHGLERGDFDVDPGVTLHQRHIAERVGRGLGEIRIMFFDGALHAEGLVHDEHGERDEADAQHKERQRKPPIQHQRGRQEQRDKDESGKMLPEERHPQPPQRVGAAEHDFHLPAGMLAGMIGERQLQHMLKVVRQHQIAPAVGEAIGEPGDQRAGADIEQAETDPGANERGERADRRRETRRQRA